MWRLQSGSKRFDARYWMLGAGALGWPRGMVQGGRREEGSRWGTRVYLWRIHVDIWQNQYNIVKLKNKIKFKKKRERERNKRPAAVLAKVRMKHSGKCPRFYPSAPVGTGEQKGAQCTCLPNQYGAVQSPYTKDAQVRTRSITADVGWTCSPGPCGAGAAASLEKLNKQQCGNGQIWLGALLEEKERDSLILYYQRPEGTYDQETRSLLQTSRCQAVHTSGLAQCLWHCEGPCYYRRRGSYQRTWMFSKRTFMIFVLD